MKDVREMENYYMVITPVYGTIIPILDYGQGPTEYGRDVVIVKASNPSKAKGKSLKKFKEKYKKGYHSYALGNGENPFTGLSVRKIDEEELEELRKYF